LAANDGLGTVPQQQQQQQRRQRQPQQQRCRLSRPLKLLLTSKTAVGCLHALHAGIGTLLQQWGGSSKGIKINGKQQRIRIHSLCCCFKLYFQNPLPGRLLRRRLL